MAIDMSQFYRTFFEESAEHLAEMERLLLELDLAAPDDEEMNAIFRAAHSIKGGSGTFGFADMAETTHVLENLLDRLRNKELHPHTAMINVLLEAVDVIKEQLDCHIDGSQADPAPAAAICERLKALAENDRPMQPAVASDVDSTARAVVASLVTPVPLGFTLVFRPNPAFLGRPGALADLFAGLGRLGVLTVISEPPAALIESYLVQMATHRPTWRMELRTEVKREVLGELFEFLVSPEEIEIEPLALDSDDPAYGFFTETSSPAKADAGYGFFTDPPAPAPAAEENDGFGFFVAVPNPAAKSVAVAEEGNGFGFFTEPPKPAPEAPSKPRAIESSRSREKPAASGDTSIRVSVERVDLLINLVGELVITQAMLTQACAGVDPNIYEKLHDGLGQLERNTRDLQESVMSMRLMPISTVFNRFPRVVRDLSQKLGKQVELKMIGEGTELDRGLIERIADPLTHLVRNSLDHGIETPERRVAAGKPASGVITLKAYQQSGNIVIEVGDDGAGLNRGKILAKARERGLAVSDGMSDSDVWGLIFEAGFSTADQVTDVSGRGVGMDVVKRNITDMGGRVDIESMAGAGTRMTVRLPLTLAILDGMSVAVGEETYIIPLGYVMESLQTVPTMLKSVGGVERLVQVRDEYLPVIPLHEVFGVSNAVSDFTQGIMILLEADGQRAALFVDALVGQHQVVIKSLEANYRKVKGISGATIMGDGRVAFILDVGALVVNASVNLPAAA